MCMAFELDLFTFNVFQKTVAVFGWIFELRWIVVCKNTNNARILVMFSLNKEKGLFQVDNKQ